MRLVIEGGYDDLTSRALVASFVGPLRRPNGRSQLVTATLSQSVLLAVNNTPDRVLFVAVFDVSGNIVDVGFSSSDGGNYVVYKSILGDGSFSCVLYPGESLYGRALTGSTTLSVFTERF